MQKGARRPIGQHVRPVDIRGQFADVIDARVQEVDAEEILDAADDRLDVEGQQHAARPPRAGSRPTPIAVPWTMKMPMTRPGESPRVRSTAMSARLSVTTITRVETMLKAATATIRNRMMLIIRFSDRQRAEEIGV